MGILHERQLAASLAHMMHKLSPGDFRDGWKQGVKQAIGVLSKALREEGADVAGTSRHFDNRARGKSYSGLRNVSRQNSHPQRSRHHRGSAPSSSEGTEGPEFHQGRSAHSHCRDPKRTLNPKIQTSPRASRFRMHGSKRTQGCDGDRSRERAPGGHRCLQNKGRSFQAGPNQEDSREMRVFASFPPPRRDDLSSIYRDMRTGGLRHALFTYVRTVRLEPAPMRRETGHGRSGADCSEPSEETNGSGRTIDIEPEA